MTHRSGATTASHNRATTTVVALLTALALALGVTPAGAESDTGTDIDVTVTEIGPANVTANVRSAEFGLLPDGTEVVFALSNGTPATFTVLDMDGEQLFAQSLEGFDLGGFAAQAEDGTVYFTARTGSYAGLFTFDPAAMEITQLDVDLQGQRVLYGGYFLDDVLYFGTYPDAMLMGYDTVAGELGDFGSLTEDAAYVFSAGIVGDEVWAGTGPEPYLFRVDPQTGDVSELLPPEHVMENTDWFIGIEQRGDYVFVRLSPRGGYDMAVYHLAEDRWLDDVIEGTFDTPVSDVVDGKVYFLVDDVLTGFDLETEQTFSTGFEDSQLHADMADAVGTYDFTVTEADDAGLPGPTVVGLNTDGHLWRYNLQTEQGELLPADVLGSPTGAHSMGVGPDGAVYMGAYLSSGAMSRIDPATQEIDYGRGPKQGDAIITHGDQLVVSSYPGAGVHVGPVDGGWEWDRTEHVLQLERGAPYFQDRIFAMASLGDRLAVGSVPDYGQVGGALTILDPVSGDFDVYRDVVEGQSVTALTTHDGLVFGGTSIHGGIDSEPTASEAELFVWDIEAAELVAHDVVVDGAAVVNQLVVGPDGNIWGLTDIGVIAIVDPETYEVVHEIDTGLTTGNVWGRTTSLYVHDDHVWGNAGGSLFRVQPDSRELEVIVEGGVRESAVDGEGQVYYAGEIDVFAVSPVEEPGEPEPGAGSLEFHLSNTWRGSTDAFFMYGRSTDEVFIGDWDGDGTDTIAVRRGRTFHVANGHRGGDADEVFVYGRAGDTILVGDWDGDGADSFAVRRGSEYHVKNSLRGGAADQVIRYGREGDEVLVGDWDGNGIDTFAVRRGSEYHVKDAIAGGPADRVFHYGRQGDVVLAGDWDGDGVDTLAVRRGKEYHVRNSLSGGPADVLTFFGHADDAVITGDWDGNGTDTLGIYRPVPPTNQLTG